MTTGTRRIIEPCCPGVWNLFPNPESIGPHSSRSSIRNRAGCGFLLLFKFVEDKCLGDEGWATGELQAHGDNEESHGKKDAGDSQGKVELVSNHGSGDGSDLGLDF